VNETIKNGTKVIVYSKSIGCPLKEIFDRSDRKYPDSVPFFGWTGDTRLQFGRVTQIIKYRKRDFGGDFYLPEDFETVELRNMFSDKDFEL
jgi:hypothetical protein